MLSYRQCSGVAVTATMIAAMVAACGSDGSTSPAATSTSVDPCSLMTDAEVSSFASGVGAHETKKQPSGLTMCVWPNSTGVSDVQLWVVKRQPGQLNGDMDELNVGGGYDIVSVPGLGDEAVAGFQRADPSRGLEAGLATIEARKGAQAIVLSVVYDQIAEGSPQFDAVKQAMSAALQRLG